MTSPVIINQRSFSILSVYNSWVNSVPHAPHPRPLLGKERGVVLLLFLLFAITQVAYLHRVPGLMGDEASEGENVYELWAGQKSYLAGERSYIGPAIDYIRMPFFAVLNHPVLALRSVTLVAALASFWLAVVVLQRIFGEDVGAWAAVVMLFSPVFMLEERMAWAISLTPFFALLALYFMQRPRWWGPTFAGLASGLGLSNHILFLPVLAGLAVAAAAYWRSRISWWLLAALGFVAAFATQAWQLLYSAAGDQGEPGAVAELFWDRLHALPKLLPLLISGSSYVARYTGVEFSTTWQYVITAGIASLAALAVIRTRPARWWCAGLVTQLMVLLVMIDRFSLRYFVPTMLGVWVLVGVGIGSLLRRREASVTAALALTVWMMFVVLLPFLRTGGSTADFSLANRTDSAAALVDARPLVTCLRGQGTVTSESVHIFNRLWFWRHYEPELKIVPEEESAQWLVQYRGSEPSHEAPSTAPGELCPELAHFRIEKR